jgi:hypothetical protein
MTTKECAAQASILDLRLRIWMALQYRDDVLLNLIDALTVGPRIASPSETAASPVWGFAPSTLYSALRSGAEDAQALERLRRARLAWLEQQAAPLVERDPRLGHWDISILDATNYPRPKAETLVRGFVHGADGMRPGHALSLLSRCVGEGSWVLPIEVRLIPVGTAPSAFGAEQVAAHIRRHGWSAEQILAVDAGYTNVPTMRPMVEAGANLLGRVSVRRVLYLPPPPYSGRGRPPKRGRKLKLSDARTLPEPDSCERIEEKGGSVEIAQWLDVRFREWPTQPVTLYRVIEYRADGRRRFRRPLWLIYVGVAEPPSPQQGRHIYGRRFGIEHSLRFLKQEMGLVAGHFNGGDAKGEQALSRVQLWVEMVATAMWQLFALRQTAGSPQLPWPASWRSRKLTPGAVRKVALAIFVRLGIKAPEPLRRGKSPGRAKGTRFAPRKRHRIFRKRKRRAAA